MLLNVMNEGDRTPHAGGKLAKFRAAVNATRSFFIGVLGVIGGFLRSLTGDRIAGCLLALRRISPP
jgi:hypothetical protein